MPRILSRRQAVADLEDIWSHIAQDNPDAADHFTDLIEAGCRILAENPLMGRLELVRVISGFRDIDVLF